MTTHDDTPTDLDEEPLARCYRHPDRETALSCIDCERPICTDCARTAAVGLKCPECAKMPRSALARIPTKRLAPAIAVGLVASVIAGFVHANISFGFFGLIIAWLLGMGIGEIMRRAAGGFRDPLLARWAAACAACGFLLPAVPVLLSGGKVNAGYLVFVVIYAAIAAFSAYQRTE